MRWHNLSTVIAYEFRRTLSKPAFWLATLSVPLLIVAIFGLSWAASSEAVRVAQQSAQEASAFTYTDASGIVDAGVARELGGTPVADAGAAAAAVRAGQADLHIDIPADPSQDPVVVTGRDIGLSDSDRWAAVAQALIEQSVQARIGDPRLGGLATSGASLEVELWRDGVRSPGWGAVIAPGAFLLLLYMAIVMLGNQMLNITVEEKENRVSEMILTMIDPTVLIAGKVIALFGVGVVQGVVTLALPLVAWGASILAFGAGDGTGGGGPVLPGGQELTIVLEPGPIIVGALLFLGGYLLLTGLLVVIGAVSPTAKDAGGAFGAVIFAIFVPLYALTLVVFAPESPVTRTLTYFPVTAPVTALIRNATGTLPPGETVAVLVLLYGTASALLLLGAKLFRSGSISYDARLSIAKVLRSKRSSQGM